LNSSANTFENDRQQYDRPAAIIVTQNYSSVNFVSLRVPSREEIFGVTFF
jgi:hypothetical protein